MFIPEQKFANGHLFFPEKLQDFHIEASIFAIYSQEISVVGAYNSVPKIPLFHRKICRKYFQNRLFALFVFVSGKRPWIRR